MSLSVQQAAILPFQILESLGLPCGYERSFKFIDQNILANRYLLGVNTIDTNSDSLQNLCRELQMPEPLLEQFWAGLEGANLVFVGFEADARGGALFKIYLEYWDRLQEKLRSPGSSNVKHLLHKGFKWQCDSPDQYLVTDYHYQPHLDTNAICQRIDAQYEHLPNSACRRTVMDIIATAQAQQSGQPFIYVEVSEPGNERCSFDLNLYPAGLLVKEVIGPIRKAAASLRTNPAQLKQLEHLVENKLLGHISAGLARNGREYFSVYYEN